MLAALGVILGVALSTASFAYLARLVPNGLPQGTSPGLDVRVLVFTAGVAALMVLGFGTGPALASTREGLDAALKAGTGRGTATSGSRRLHHGLVVAEVTLTVVLLVAAGLLLRSYADVLAVDPGFRSENLLIAETILSPSTYATFDRRLAFYDRVLERVTALPGVTAAAYVNFPPLVFKGGRAFFTIEGRPAPAREDFTRYNASDRTVSEGYFSTLRVPWIRGRQFDQRDGPDAPLAVIINEKMARMHWPHDDPLGHRIKIGAIDTNPWFTIVERRGRRAADGSRHASRARSVLFTPSVLPERAVFLASAPGDSHATRPTGILGRRAPSCLGRRPGATGVKHSLDERGL